MLTTDEAVRQGPEGVSNAGQGAAKRFAEIRLERTSRALRLSVDVACLGLLFYAWTLAAEVPVGHLITLWLASCLAIPRSPFTEHLRQQSMASAVILLLGIWLIVTTLRRDSFEMAEEGLYPMRNVFQGLLFALAGVSNLLATKAYPEQKTTVSSLCCGVAAAAAGILWVWLAMHAGGIS